MNPKCEYCDEWNDAAGCQSEILCPFDDNPRKSTNGDRIRAMSNEELAAWHEKACPPGDYASRCRGIVCCEECWKNWLEKEVER